MSEPGTYLDKILAAKRAELAGARPGPGVRDLETALSGLSPARDFAAALRRGPAPTAIAEFKRASPSEGDIRPEADPREIARSYVESGAACISVLTDRHFRGSLDDLRAVRNAVPVPILRKDFIVQASQIIEARREGADAVLLIVAALDPPRLRELMGVARDCGLQVLCEAHDEREVDRAMAAGAQIVGVNARDLRTFEVDLDRTIALRERVPASFVYVAESGIRSREDVGRLREAGVDAVLVGTHLMRAEDPGLALMDLLSMGPGAIP